MHTSRGLFHYPPDNFNEGFGEPPARFYYRPYYNHLYSQLSNWWRKCLDGELLAEVFMDSWFRFERMFSKVPHFGFTFISSLTHDDPSNLEFLDHTLYHRLAYLNVSSEFCRWSGRWFQRTGSIENTVLIVLGDHGNRVHPINRYTFAGKIGKKPEWFSVSAVYFQKNVLHSSQYLSRRDSGECSRTSIRHWRRTRRDSFRELDDETNKLGIKLRNFDLHATLKSVLNPDSEVKSRGTSLFEPQNPDKSCQDNGVISNHCLCMVDASQDFKSMSANYYSSLSISFRSSESTDSCRYPRRVFYEEPWWLLQCWNTNVRKCGQCLDPSVSYESLLKFRRKPWCQITTFKCGRGQKSVTVKLFGRKRKQVQWVALNAVQFRIHSFR